MPSRVIMLVLAAIGYGWAGEDSGRWLSSGLCYRYISPIAACTRPIHDGGLQSSGGYPNPLLVRLIPNLQARLFQEGRSVGSEDCPDSNKNRNTDLVLTSFNVADIVFAEIDLLCELLLGEPQCFSMSINLLADCEGNLGLLDSR